MTYPSQSSDALDAAGAFVIGGGEFDFGQTYTESIIRDLFQVPTATFGNALDLLKEYLLKMPLDALKAFQGLIGLADDAFETVTGAVESIMGSLGESVSKGIRTGIDLLKTVFNQIVDILRGLVVTPINDSVQGVKDFINGITGGIAHGVSEFGELLDSVWSGLLNVLGGGKSIADVASAAQTTATKADAGLQVGEWNSAILGLRNNKSLMEGVDETEEANFTLESLWASSTPAAVVSATASSVPVAYKRFSEVAKKGFITWFGKDIVTELRIDVYRGNSGTSTWEHIHTSPNVASMVDGTWRYLQYSIAEVLDRIDVVSGDVLGVAWRVVGSGTHSIAGIPNNQPAHPSTHPKRPQSVRTGVGNLDYASTSYTLNSQPWFGIGIITGDIPPPYLSPRTQTFSDAGSATYVIPEQFRIAGMLFDRVVLGAGGGGGGSANIFTGQGGDRGKWGSDTLVYGSADLPLGTTTMNVVVGARGTLGNRFLTPSTSGGASSVGGAGVKPLSALGGARGGTGTAAAGNPAGISGLGAGSIEFAGAPYLAGGNVPAGAPGSAPGGGGGGANPYSDGGHGSPGRVWITARQP